MKSMTGYGHAVYRTDDYSIEINIKSYNNRYLDIVKNISFQLSPFESLVDSEVKKVASRGHIEISAKLKIFNTECRITVDEGLLDEYCRAFSLIEEKCGEKATVSDYLSINDLIVPDIETNGEIYRDAFIETLREALTMLEGEKIREGEGTKRDLEKLGEQFKASLSSIEARSGELEGHYKKLLTEKYEEISGNKGNTPDFMQELGAILVRYSINEEVSRLHVHIAEYERLLASSGPVGKKLDFLCQEMQRECNTIATKSQLVEINLAVVSMKDNIEDIREQLRNIE